MGGLGFRDLEVFNRALIAKQAWRVFQQPDSIVAQILAAKYFPHSSIIDASLGSRPSFLWRSLIAGRDFLKTGRRWCIGDGKDIRVFQDPWLPLEPNFQPIWNSTLLDYESKVCELLVPGKREWNSNLIRNAFFGFEADRILEILMGTSSHQDKLIWHHDRKGIYTVKSGYMVGLLQKIQEGNTSHTHATSSSGQKGGAWSLPWTLPIQPRVQHFLWRLVQNCLPTAINLKRRGLSDGICSMCSAADETLEHCLMECILPRAVAAHSPAVSRWFSRRTGSFASLISSVREEEGDFGACQLIYLLWYVWKARCGWIFDEQPIFITRLCQEAFANAVEYHNINMPASKEAVRNAEALGWSRPQQGYAKVNVDGSIKDDVAAVGAIIRNADGVVLHSISKQVHGSRSPETVELLAIKEGLTAAHNAGFACIELESDCLVAVSRLTTVEPDLSELGNIAIDIRRLASIFNDVIFMHAKRSCNLPAHLLAQHGLSSNSQVIWGIHIPANVLAAVAADSN